MIAAVVFATTAPELIRAAGQLRPQLAAEWAREGPKYMSAALREVGAPFPYREMQAYLTVCKSAGTMSQPLMINVRQYVDHPSPDGDSSEKLFHERGVLAAEAGAVTRVD